MKGTLKLEIIVDLGNRWVKRLLRGAKGSNPDPQIPSLMPLPHSKFK